MKEYNILSLFGGIECGRLACERAGIKVKNYFSSEVDKYAIAVTKANWPDVRHIGDITGVVIEYDRYNDVTTICNIWSGECFTFEGMFDLIIGGSPCQDLRPGRDGLKGKKSKLFYEYLRVLNTCKEINPDLFFFLENVAKISDDDKTIISELLNVEPIPVCSSLFSAQNRRRLYWTNLPINPLPKKADKTNLIDILYEQANKEYLIPEQIERAKINHSAKTWKSGNKMGAVKFPTLLTGKAKTLLTVRIKGDRSSNHVQDKNGIRLLNATEYERLQNLPDNYTGFIPDNKRFIVIGNGWTIGAITHFFLPLGHASFMY